MPVSPRKEGAADADRGLAPADPKHENSGKKRSALTSAFEELALHTNQRSPEVRPPPRAPPRPLASPRPIFSRVSPRDAFVSLSIPSTVRIPTHTPRPASTVRPERA